MKRKMFLVLVIVLIAALALSGCGKKPDATTPTPQQPVEEFIKIGSVMPVTGAIATFGVSSVEAIELAFKEINAEGGVLGGKKLKLYNEDNRSTAEETATAFQKLIEQEKVVAIIGSVASSHSLAGAPIAQDAKIPTISPTSTNPAVTLIGDYIFRACFLDPFQGEMMAKFALNELGLTTAAMIVEQESDYAKGLAQFFKQHFEAGGGTVVQTEEFSNQDKDFTAILTNIKAKNPEFVYIPSYYDTVGPILRQAKDMELNAQFGGGDGWDSADLFDLAGDAANGGFFSNHYSPDIDSPEVKKFLASYMAEYGKVPDALAALAYDAAYLMARAIDAAGSTDGTAIRDALAAITFTGVSGNIVFDANGDPVKTGVIVGIENQTQVYKATIQP
ncbi:MAG: ABC transporter substrate-binding protein [Clostridiales bacterium]|jgi:branched-chain amino acid transport system substrate-binding protein|nr:ABC transporter substrate-binding protein [Clostridiales bacterium]